MTFGKQHYTRSDGRLIRYKLWECITDTTEFYIRTPWFILWIKNGVKEFYRHGYSWGFSLGYGKNKNISEGCTWFRHYYNHESFFLSHKDMICDR